MLDKKRATQAEDKLLRRAEILNAAAALFLENDQQLPSVQAIASRAGLAKGTVYLYFRTKEEIFQALLESQFSGLFEALDSALRAGVPAMQLSDLLVAYLRSQPAFLPLTAMAKSVIEQNLGLGCGESFKLQLARQLSDSAVLLEEAYPALAGQGETLLLRTYALMMGLWQMLDWPAQLKPLQQQPEFRAFARDYYAELRDALQMLWGSALQS